MHVYRHIIIVLVGATMFAITWWLSHVWVATLGINLGHLEVIAFVPGWLGALHHLLPGLVVGMISPRLAARHAVAAVVLGSIALHAYQFWLGFPLEVFNLVNATCLNFAYASIAALSGAVLREAWSDYASKPAAEQTPGTGRGPSRRGRITRR